jgi:ABC-type nickel/cobalt efflux system permease component RcnA
MTPWTMLRWPLLMAAAAVAVGLTALGQPAPVAAHPLGNFTVNHSTTIEVGAGEATVYRVLDLAEIPAFVELERMPVGPGGELLLDAWGAGQAAELASALALEIDGAGVALLPVGHRAEVIDGEGGLKTLRLEVSLRGGLAAALSGESLVKYSDAFRTDRVGWREVVVRAGAGARIDAGELPGESPSAELRAYPKGAAPDVREARFSASPRPGYVAPAAPSGDARAATDSRPGTGDAFAGLIGRRQLGAGFLAWAVIAAVAFGALHALSPGHGKTVVAAYLVGARGTLRHAALLGLVVTATHTASVYALGLTAIYLSQFIVPEDLYPWMSLVSGAIVLVMGGALLASRLRRLDVVPRAMLIARRRVGAVVSGERGSLRFATVRAAARSAAPALAARGEHSAGSASPAHAHAHGPWSRSHSHDVDETVTWRRLVGLGVFGGMMPCPSAIVVMLSAIALHRVAFGMLLIVAFSAGLAAVLTGIGFLVVWAQRLPRVQHLIDRAESSHGMAALTVRTLPLVSAALVCAVGAVMTSRALVQF